MKVFEASSTQYESKVGSKSRMHVAAKTWFEARAIAAVVLGSAPERVKAIALDEYVGTAFHRPSTACSPSSSARVTVHHVEKKRGRECRILSEV